MMRRSTFSLALFAMAACTAVQPQPSVPAASTPSRPEVKIPPVVVHVGQSLAREDNWFANWLGFEMGREVAVKARHGRGTSVYVDIVSDAGGACSLTIYLSENERGETLADVFGTWFLHSVNPPRGHLTDFQGDIYLEKPLGASTEVHLRFALSATGRRKERVALMGGVTVSPQPASESTTAR